MFNEFDLNESGDTVLEVYAPQEYGMWVDSGDIPSFRLTVDIPVGYSTPILYMWNPFTNDYELLDSESQFVTNPRYSSRTINGVTYNSYVRGPEDEQNPRGTTQYKIIITKE